MRGLNKLYWLKIDMDNIRKEIDNLPTVSSPQITGMPHGTRISNPTVEYVLRKEFLEEQLAKLEEKYKSEFKRISGVIKQIDDPDIQAIARMRLIDNMEWEDIGAKMYLDRTTCSKRLRKYIKNMDI